MKKALCLLFLSSSLLHAAPPLIENGSTLTADTRFLERFADPETRAQSLALLVPGTDDAFFYTALNQQLIGLSDDCLKTLQEWRTIKGKDLSRDANTRIRVLESRQLLMDYEKNPKASLEGLIRFYDLNFDETRPDAAAEEKLPSILDPSLISEAKFEATIQKASPTQPYTKYKGERLLRELDHVADFDRQKVLWFMSHLPRTDYPGTTALIEKAYSFDPLLIFSSITYRDKFTSQQCEDLLKRLPKLRENEAFCILYMSKLRPGSEVDFAKNFAAHAAHLQKCKDFALTLPPSLSLLKQHVLFQHLLLQRKLGNYPKEDFIQYLALPISRGSLLRSKTNGDLFNRNQDFSDATGCAGNGYDEETVSEFLTHFLSDTDSSSDFSPYVEEKALAQIHARARLQAGADTKRWGTVLKQEEYQAFLNETRIIPAPDAPTTYDVNGQTTLPLELKNTPDLLVRIYELDQPSYLLLNRKEPTAELELAGLVPHHERKITFSQEPLIQHRESISLPELSGTGVWLVDFVSGNTSARALIRKGSLTPYVQPMANGQLVTIFDEKSNPVAGAILQLGNETWTAGADGTILVPDSNLQLTSTGIIRSGKIATPVTLEPRAERLALEVRFLLDREQLLSDKQATLQLRVRLTNRGMEIPLDRLEHAALILKAELEGGVSAERVVAENLKLQPSFGLPFQVPANLRSLSFTLNTTVNQAGKEPLKLKSESRFEDSAPSNTNPLFGTFYSVTSGGHRLELRGLNGEPLAHHYLNLVCSREGYDTTVSVPVRTDEQGRVELGKLDDIISLSPVSYEYGNLISYFPPITRDTRPARSIQVALNEEVRVSLAAPDSLLQRSHCSLLEINNEGVLTDHYDKLTLSDGILVIKGLTAGSYILKQGAKTTNIEVTDGVERNGLLVSNARILPRLQPAQPVIATAQVDSKELFIKVANSSETTRVTLIGRRFYSPINLYGALPFTTPLPNQVSPGFIGSAYLTDLRISDEIRYILDRRSENAFPGTMLPRPGLLMQRWASTEMNQGKIEGKGGTRGNYVPESAPAMSKASEQGERGRNGSKDGGYDFDFLAHSSVVRFDLKPSPDGSIRLPLADFSHSQFITIIAADANASDKLTLPLPAKDTEVRDRRIAKPLDPAKDFHVTRSAITLKKGEEATIQNLLDSDWRSFNTLADTYQLLYGISNDDRLREFAFLTVWPDITDERKQELLSKYACNELSLFIFRKDRAFFDKYVKPLISQKLEPQFIDDYLMQRDLSRYLRPYAWQKLNAAEKALLSQALPDAHKRISRELFQRWLRDAPAPEVETRLFTQTLRGADLASMTRLTEMAEKSSGSGGVARITQKLNSIILPQIDFEETTVGNAVEFLRLRSMELDTSETDPSRRGVNFVIESPSISLPPSTEPGLNTSASTGGIADLKVKLLKLRNVPLGIALKYICDQTKLRYKVGDYAVTLVAQTEAGEDLYTRTYTIPPDFSSSLGMEDSVRRQADGDPFAEASPTAQRKATKQLLEATGISFPEGSSVSISGDQLIVTNTPTELDKVGAITAEVGAITATLAEPRLPGSADGMGVGDGSSFDASVGRNRLKLSGARELKLEVDATRERGASFPSATRLWRESNYYHHSGSTGESLISLNAFWLDLASWDGNGVFISPHFNTCTRNANEALFCLTMLDLPFKADRPEVTADGAVLRVKAAGPMLLFYKDIRPTENVAPDSPYWFDNLIYLGEKAALKADGRTEENAVTGDFLTGVPYKASLVITNPTGLQRRIDVLAQIPAGAIPLQQKPATLSSTHQLLPHGVLHLELAFYFPSAGDFKAYPLHVSEGKTTLAHTEARTLRVVAQRPAPDSKSWSEIINKGTDEQVLAYLREAELPTNPYFEPIRWRLNDRHFFTEVSKLLKERLIFSDVVAPYGLVHDDKEAIRDMLENRMDDFGSWLNTPLLSIRPAERDLWQTVDFDPLINARAHSLGGQSRMTHAELQQYYQSFLTQLAWKPSLEAADQLQFTALLLLQDRLPEAIKRFEKIDPSKLPGRLSYDYMQAVILFYQEKTAEARSIANAILPTLPGGMWKDRFQAVINQANEITTLTEKGIAEEKAKDAATSLDLSLTADGKLYLKHQGMKQATLRLFSVDLEALFSNAPFALASSGNIPLPAILPNETREVKFTPDSNETTIDLPAELLKGGLLISAEAGSTKLLKVLDSTRLGVRQYPADRIVQAIDPETQRPLAKTYIKVYAENQQGEVFFYKDGYTDLRGKFDYLSSTSMDPATIKRLAILVSHPEKGARTLIDERSGNLSQ